MKRTAWTVAVVVALAMVLGRVFVSSQRQASLSRPVIALPDGTALRVEGLTWGPTNQEFHLEPHWLGTLRKRLPPFLARLAGPGPMARTTYGPHAHLWLSRLVPGKNTLGSVPWMDLKVLGAGGEEWQSSGGVGFGGGRASYGADLPVVPWRQDPLRFHITFAGKPLEFSLPNPRAGVRFPVWTAEPLPGRREAGGFVFELSSSGGSQRLRALRDGTDVTEWFRFDKRFTDPTGNIGWKVPRDEPVWGLDVAAWPEARFPVPEEQIYRLGPARIPGAGEFHAFTPSPRLTNAGMAAAWLLGPGSFRFSNGTNEWASPEPGTGGSSESDGDSYRFTLERGRPSLVIVLRAPISGAALSPAGGFDVQLAARVFSSSDRVETVSEGASTAANGTTRIVNAGFGLEMTRPGQEIHAELFLSRAIRTSFRFANPAAAPAR